MATTRTHRGPDPRYPNGTRPTRDIYDIVAYDRGGKPIRVIDRAIETLRIGGSIPDVAARCGIDVSVVREWIRRGTAVSADVFGGRRELRELSRHERKCHDFVQLTAQAEVDGKLYLLGLAEKLSEGGFTIETVTEKVDAKGNVIERSTKKAGTAPDGNMIRWRLATRWPKEFRDRTALELTGADGGPVQVEAGPVIDRLLAELTRIAENTAATDELLAAHEPVSPNGNGAG